MMMINVLFKIFPYQPVISNPEPSGEKSGFFEANVPTPIVTCFLQKDVTYRFCLICAILSLKNLDPSFPRNSFICL